MGTSKKVEQIKQIKHKVLKSKKSNHLFEKVIFRHFKKVSKGFTLIELLTVVAILGILAAISIPSYLRYKKKAYEAWVINEMSLVSKFLYMAYDVDGGFHQYLEAMGYRPLGNMLGNVGFRKDYDSEDTCCDRYPKDPTDPADPKYGTLGSFTYIDSTRTNVDGNSICGPLANCNVLPGPGHNIKNFTTMGVKSGTTSCIFKITTGGIIKTDVVECDCDEFTIVGGTRYGKTTGSADMKIGDGVGILALDHTKQLCKADSSGNFQPH